MAEITRHYTIGEICDACGKKSDEHAVLWYNHPELRTDERKGVYNSRLFICLECTKRLQDAALKRPGY